MSIAQRALRLAIRPLLNERHRTGRVEGHVEGRSKERQEWEAWLRRQQEAGATWHSDDPPPSGKPQE